MKINFNDQKKKIKVKDAVDGRLYRANSLVFLTKVKLPVFAEESIEKTEHCYLVAFLDHDKGQDGLNGKIIFLQGGDELEDFGPVTFEINLV